MLTLFPQKLKISSDSNMIHSIIRNYNSHFMNIHHSLRNDNVMTEGQHPILQNFSDRYYELFTLTTKCVIPAVTQC